MTPHHNNDAPSEAASYDPAGIHQTEFVYSSPISSVLRLHDVNKLIHSIPSLPPLLEFIVFLFGYAFNPVSIPLWMAVASATGAAPAALISNSRDNNNSSSLLLSIKVHQHQFAVMPLPLDLFAPLFYLSTVLVTLLGTEICKATFRATRPESLLSQEFRTSKLRRYGTLVASLKSKHSFPSGDSAQAANAVLFLYYYIVPLLFLDDGNGTNKTTTTAICWLAFGVFYPGVAFARIFYHCHWIEDCLGGAFLAGILHATIMPRASNLLWQVLATYLQGDATVHTR